MKLLWNRRALGGVLAGLGLFVGVERASRAQNPAYAPPPIQGQPVVPASYQQPAPAGSSAPAMPFVPTQPGHQPPADAAIQPAPQPMHQPPVATPSQPIQPSQPVYLPPAPASVQPQPQVFPVGTPALATPFAMQPQSQPGGFAVDPTAPPAGMPTTGMNPAPVANPPASSPTDPTNLFQMTARWNEPNPGVWIETANKNFVFHPGATVHYDGAWYSATPFLETGPGGTGKFNDGANLRRARIFFEGTLYHQVDYKFELEFMNGIGVSPAGTLGPVTQTTVTNTPGPTDAWVNIKDVPFLGNVRIGSQKEWFSLEHINNFRALEFLERSYLFDLAQLSRFNNGFSPGVSMFRTWLDQRVFTAAGMYKNISDPIGFNFGDGQYAFTGRVAALPVWMPDDHIFWHIGGAMSHRDPVNGQVVVSARDNVRNAPLPLLNLIINAGAINATSQDLYNLETAFVWKSLTFQAEYTANVINGASVGTGPNMGSLLFEGYYAEVMWLLTGESRSFNRSLYALNRVVPRRPLWFKRDPNCGDGERGFGAWELAARYSYLDVSNKAVQVGRLNSVTLGLNWYLNTSVKLQFNYDYTQRNDTNLPHGHIHAFGSRMAVDF